MAHLADLHQAGHLLAAGPLLDRTSPLRGLSILSPAAHIDGAFRPGASFEWTSYGFTVVSAVYAVAERARVLWGGTAGGITGIHEWVFSETPTGVHVTTDESFAGEPVEADVTGMQSALDSSLISWLAHLKAAAESKG
jgi:hypothetical protein